MCRGQTEHCRPDDQGDVRGRTLACQAMSAGSNQRSRRCQRKQACSSFPTAVFSPRAVDGGAITRESAQHCRQVNGNPLYC